MPPVIPWVGCLRFALVHDPLLVLSRACRTSVHADARHLVFMAGAGAFPAPVTFCTSNGVCIMRDVEIVSVRLPRDNEGEKVRGVVSFRYSCGPFDGPLVIEAWDKTATRKYEGETKEGAAVTCGRVVGQYQVEVIDAPIYAKRDGDGFTVFPRNMRIPRDVAEAVLEKAVKRLGLVSSSDDAGETPF